MTIDLSVLVCSTHTRYATFGLEIQRQLFKQYFALPEEDRTRVEIIVLTDNKKMMLGAKRNAMVDIAQGEYVVFVDDDDRLESTYLANILNATRDGCDVITFQASVSINGAPPKICRYSTSYDQDRNTEDGYERLPNHICAVRRSLASQVSFPNIAYGEDSSYAQLLKPLLRSESTINGVLYHYDYNSATTETQEHLKAKLRIRADQKALVDVVIMSKAEGPEIRPMTQEAVNSCISGANSLAVNVIVMEQIPGIRYENARTIYAGTGGEFNYNHNANMGAGLGFAQWIVVANNDVIFDDGWLHRLLAAGHPFVSPKCLVDRRQDEIVENTIGDVTGKHLSGWCFMITRELWHKIGRFDEDVAFWCSDDAVIEQTRAVGVLPMLVPSATVMHLGSQTLKTSPNRDYLTWGQLDRFIQKYGHHRLENHPEYLEWKALVGVK